MFNNKKSSGKGFALGALFGGIFGGLAALLFAPKSGKQTRKDLAKKCRSFSDKTHSVHNDICESCSNFLEKAKETLSELLK